MRQKWSRAKVVKTIRQLHKAGVKLNAARIKRHKNPLFNATARYYGSWKKAVEAAGLDYSKIKVTKKPRIWSKSKVIASIKVIYRKEGKLNCRFVSRHYSDIYAAARAYFGKWGIAVKTAGFSYDSVCVKRRQGWSKTKVLAEIVARKKTGKSLNGSIVSKEDGGLYFAARQYFGKKGWKRALGLLGIDDMVVDPRTTWTKLRVIDEILSLHRKNIPLNMHYLRHHGMRTLVWGGVKFFGSWGKAIKAAGLCYNRIKLRHRNWWNIKRIKRAIQRLELKGLKLNSKSIQDTRPALYEVALKYFGSWGAAVEAAGVNYRAHLLVWSHKTWLRNLPKGAMSKLRASSEKLAVERRRSV